MIHGDDMDGILLINKEAGMTSHDVVAQLRKILHIKKIGHSGTLDPNATGVLLVLVGRACKVLPFLADTDKEYIASMELGKKTISDDIWEEVLDEKPVIPIKDLQKELDKFRGVIEQVPPMISSIKVNGKKLYELAREGKVVERKSRKVQIYDIRIKEMKLPRIRMEVSCSKGTYIRTLCNDVGEVLGVGGCMESLLRTKVSRFELKDSMKLADIEKAKNEGRTEEIILPLDEVFVEYPKIIVTGRQAQLAKESAKNLILPGKDGGEDDLSDIFSRYKKYRVYDEQGRFIAIYSYQKQRQLFRIEKMFFDPDGK